MKDKQCFSVINEIFMSIFGYPCSLNIQQVMSEFAFDIRLPHQVIDAVDGEENGIAGINAVGMAIPGTQDHERSCHQVTKSQ